MLSSYIRSAWRNLSKNKVYSFINIFGLTVGLSCFLLIALYVFDELTFDRFHSNGKNIYRVIEHKTTAEGKESNVASVAYNISEKGRSELPEINRSARLSMLGRANVYNDDNQKSFYEFYWLASEDFLKMFDFKLLAGDRNTAFKQPNSVVVTAETAKKIFGHTDVMGKSLRADRDSLPFRITGVLEDFPTNSHIKFNLAFSESSLNVYENFRNFMSNDWASNTFITYLQLNKGHDHEATGKKILEMVARNRTESTGSKSDFWLQPLHDIHFKSANIDGSFDGGNIMYIYVFCIVAMFVILIACINYMNLTTARFANRAKEIAVRKVTGAARKDLITQFFAEALLVSVLSLVLAIGVVNLLLPPFNAFAEKELSLGLTTDLRIWIGVILIVLLVGLISGVYPALFQSGLKPYLLLKNKFERLKTGFPIRKVLVVLQFSLSIIMIIATIIVFKQLQYVEKKDMGFNKDQLLVVDINSGAVRRSAETIKAEYAKISSVRSVSATSRVPGEWKVIPKVKVKNEKITAKEGSDMYFMAVDENYLKTFEIRLVNGRNLAPNSGDSSAVLINEKAAEMLGITAASEQVVQIPSVDFSGNVSSLAQPFVARVVGIVKDFNFRSLREEVAPLILAWQRNPVHNIDYFTARINTGNVEATLQQMESILQKIDQEHLFEYNFLDKQWELFYREDKKRQTLFIGVAILTILIACLGLFGLSTYAAQQRVKEIGIRKVLGASVASIVNMLSKDFLKLVLIASVISFPIAYWAMNNWLNDFAYRINISWWIFLLAAVLALVIAFITVSFHAIRAGLSNPVTSLRTE